MIELRDSDRALCLKDGIKIPNINKWVDQKGRILRLEIEDAFNLSFKKEFNKKTFCAQCSCKFLKSLKEHGY